MQLCASDSDYDKEVSEYVKDEKRRKQMESMAEDLFNTERVSCLACWCNYLEVKHTDGEICSLWI